MTDLEKLYKYLAERKRFLTEFASVRKKRLAETLIHTAKRTGSASSAKPR